MKYIYTILLIGITGVFISSCVNETKKEVSKSKTIKLVRNIPNKAIIIITENYIEDAIKATKDAK